MMDRLRHYKGHVADKSSAPSLQSGLGTAAVIVMDKPPTLYNCNSHQEIPNTKKFLVPPCSRAWALPL